MRVLRKGVADSAEERISDAIVEAGFEPVSVWVVGQDPASRAVRAVAVFDDPAARWGEGYTVSDFWDYARNPDKTLRARGLIDAPYLAGVTRGEAMQCASNRIGSLLSSCSWLIPGTDELVPGCWMEYDERWGAANRDLPSSAPRPTRSPEASDADSSPGGIAVRLNRNRLTKKAIMVQNTKKKTPAKSAAKKTSKPRTASGTSKPKAAPATVQRSARRRNIHTYTEERPLRVVELFSGIGAQKAALTKAGIPHETVAICDIDENAVRMYRAIHGEDIPNLGDISEIDRLPDCDLLTYSFPCQSLSKAGQRKGMAQGSGTTSSLVWEVGRLLDEAESRRKLPEELIMENVPAIRDRNNIVNFEQWIKELHEKGYTSSYDIVNAKDHGIPQNRERCFMVSSLHNGRFVFPEKRPLKKTLGDFLEEDVPEEYYLSQERVDTYHRHKVRHQAKGSGLYYRPVNAESVAHTVTLSPSRDSANFLVEAGECEGVRAAPRLKEDGMLGDSGYEIVRRVYDPEGGLSPTINTAQGGGRVPKIIERESSRNRRRAKARWLRRGRPLSMRDTRSTSSIRHGPRRATWRRTRATDSSSRARSTPGAPSRRRPCPR